MLGSAISFEPSDPFTLAIAGSRFWSVKVTQVHCLLSSDDDDQASAASGGMSAIIPEEVLSLFEINSSLVQGPTTGRDGSSNYVAFAPIRGTGKAATMVCVEMDASEGLDRSRRRTATGRQHRGT